jgi:hypothetical protein
MVGINLRSGQKRVKVAAKRWLKLFPTVPLYSFGHAVRLGGAHGINRTTHKFNLLRPLRDKNLAVVCWTDSAVYANQVIFFSTCAAAQCTVYIVVELIQPGVALQPPSNDDDVKQRCQLPKKEITSTPPDRQGAGDGRYTCTIKMVDINKWTGGYQEGKSHPVLVKRDWIPRYLMMPQPIAVAAAAIAEYLPGLAQLVHSIVL